MCVVTRDRTIVQESEACCVCGRRGAFEKSGVRCICDQHVWSEFGSRDSCIWFGSSVGNNSAGFRLSKSQSNPLQPHTRWNVAETAQLETGSWRRCYVRRQRSVDFAESVCYI